MSKARDVDDPERAMLLVLGSEIRAWRMRRGLSREELAGLAGISATTLGRIERDGPVDVGDTFRLANALGVGLPDLVRRAEETLTLDETDRTSDEARRVAARHGRSQGRAARAKQDADATHPGEAGGEVGA